MITAAYVPEHGISSKYKLGIVVVSQHVIVCCPVNYALFMSGGCIFLSLSLCFAIAPSQCVDAVVSLPFP